MANAPSPRTWVDGEIPPYSTVTSEIYDTMHWLLQPPMVKLRQTTGQSLTHNTYTAVTWNVEDFDPYNWHNPTVNSSRITPTYPGWYRGWIAVGFGTSTAGSFRVALLGKNGTHVRSRRDAKPSTTAGHARRIVTPFLIPMNGTTDYVEAFAYQDTGGALALQTSSHLLTYFFMRWCGSL